MLFDITMFYNLDDFKNNYFLFFDITYQTIMTIIISAIMIHIHILPYPPLTLAAATCVAATAAWAVVVATTWPFIVVTGVRSVVAGAGAW